MFSMTGSLVSVLLLRGGSLLVVSAGFEVLALETVSHATRLIVLPKDLKTVRSFAADVPRIVWYDGSIYRMSGTILLGTTR
jgi:hypothetical protein